MNRPSGGREGPGKGPEITPQPIENNLLFHAVPFKCLLSPISQVYSCLTPGAHGGRRGGPWLHRRGQTPGTPGRKSGRSLLSDSDKNGESGEKDKAIAVALAHELEDDRPPKVVAGNVAAMRRAYEEVTQI